MNRTSGPSARAGSHRSWVVAALAIACLTVTAPLNAQTSSDAWVYPPSIDGEHFLFDLYVAQHLVTLGQYQQFGFAGLIQVGPVRVVGQTTFQNDGKYASQQSGFWLGFNGTLDTGGVELDAEPFRIRAGRHYHHDLVSSPYSLFVSSERLPALQLDLSFETTRLFATTRWLELNRNSRLGYPDRGANIRSYGVRLGDVRIGFQDALVYTGRRFDLEYLLSPVPGFFLQYIKITGGSPWAEVGNDNSILGLFADYERAGQYAYAQVLIDDFNFNAIANPDGPQNPSKVAWSIGGRYPTRFGTVGAYHAGATKYTFQAYGAGAPGSASDTRYGYTYYPGVEYEVDGEPRAILPEENYIGYRNGENNLAFQVDLQTVLAPRAPVQPIELRSALELTLTGSQSPANPWHEYNTWSEGGPGTKLFGDDRLEVEIASRSEAATRLGPWLFFASLELGYIANELELTAVPPELAGTPPDPDNSIRYFSPGTTSRFFAGLELGVRLRLDATPPSADERD